MVAPLQSILTYHLHGSLPHQIFDAFDPALVGRDGHLSRLDDDGILALFLKLNHYLAGAGRGVGRGLERGEHLFRGALNVDANANA